VVEDFNPDAFINCNDYENDFEAIINRVKEIDSDDELAMRMICTPPMRKEYDFDWQTKLGGYLERIIEKGNAPYNAEKSFNDTSFRGSELANELTLNNRIYGGALLEHIKKDKNVMIYGDGKYAAKLTAILKRVDGVVVEGVIVSKKHEGRNELQGIPIIEFDEKVIDKDSLIMVAVREEAQEVLVKGLWDKGYRNLISVNNYIVDIIRSVM
jgi:ribosomal protein L24